jgi:hypothetical protein
MPLSGIFQKPPQKPESIQAHVSLFPRYLSCSGKLSATNRNTRAKEELFACALEKLKFD